MLPVEVTVGLSYLCISFSPTFLFLFFILPHIYVFLLFLGRPFSGQGTGAAAQAGCSAGGVLMKAPGFNFDSEK